MYYKLRCNSTQFVIYYKLRNYYKLQRNKGVTVYDLTLEYKVTFGRGDGALYSFNKTPYH